MFISFDGILIELTCIDCVPCLPNSSPFGMRGRCHEKKSIGARWLDGRIFYLAVSACAAAPDAPAQARAASDRRAAATRGAARVGGVETALRAAASRVRRQCATLRIFARLAERLAGTTLVHCDARLLTEKSNLSTGYAIPFRAALRQGRAVRFIQGTSAQCH
jgi:hypothetical protein